MGGVYGVWRPALWSIRHDFQRVKQCQTLPAPGEQASEEDNSEGEMTQGT